MTKYRKYFPSSHGNVFVGYGKWVTNYTCARYTEIFYKLHALAIRVAFRFPPHAVVFFKRYGKSCVRTTWRFVWELSNHHYRMQYELDVSVSLDVYAEQTHDRGLLIPGPSSCFTISLPKEEKTWPSRLTWLCTIEIDVSSFKFNLGLTYAYRRPQNRWSWRSLVKRLRRWHTLDDDDDDVSGDVQSKRL